MTRVIADALLRGSLQNMERPVEICDESGRVLGHFLPALDPAEYEGLDSPLSKEELQRRKQNKGKTYSTTEVLSHLEKL